jgi:hypothetical protein
VTNEHSATVHGAVTSYVLADDALTLALTPDGSTSLGLPRIVTIGHELPSRDLAELRRGLRDVVDGAGDV